MSEPKKQHFVPKVYLKRFGIKTNSNEVYTLKIRSKFPERVKRKTTSQICYSDRIYTFDDSEIIAQIGIVDPNIIEKQSFPYEKSELKTLFNKIHSRAKITQADFEKILRISLDIKMRNPRMANKFCNHSINAESLAFEPGTLTNNFLSRFNLDDVEAANVLKSCFIAANKKFKNANFKLNTYRRGIYEKSPSFGEVIDNCIKWTPYILQSSPKHPFITSDNPGFTVDENNVIYDTNFAHIAAFFFPISPCNILFLARAKSKSFGLHKKINYIKIDSSFVNMINLATTKNANSIIISHDLASLESIRSIIYT